MATLEQNKEIVQRIFNEFWLAGKTSVLDQLLATDVTNHELSKEPVSGRDAYKQWATGFRQVTGTGFPDMRIVLDALVGEGDLVTKRWTFRGYPHRRLYGASSHWETGRHGRDHDLPDREWPGARELVELRCARDDAAARGDSRPGGARRRQSLKQGRGCRCHPERSEGGHIDHGPLRFAQGDRGGRVLPALSGPGGTRGRCRRGPRPWPGLPGPRRRLQAAHHGPRTVRPRRSVSGAARTPGCLL